MVRFLVLMLALLLALTMADVSQGVIPKTSEPPHQDLVIKVPIRCLWYKGKCRPTY